MGEPVLGMQAATYIQLTYLGWVTAGGSMPGNLVVVDICGTALTVLPGADPKLTVSFAVTLSLLGILISQTYMILNSVWIHRADRCLGEGSLKGIRLINYTPSGILSLVLYGISVMLMIPYGAQWAQDTLAMIPQRLADALNLIGAVMLTLDAVILLNYLGKKKLIAFFFFSFFAAVYLELDTMSLFISSAVIAAVVYFFGRDREEGGTQS